MTLMLESAGPEQTAAIGAALGRLAQGGDVLLLQGPLGAGKTCLTQGLARGLSVPGPVTSPTFILVKVTVAEENVPRIPHPPVAIRDRFRVALGAL
jgi:tRNA threonylcarbamoyl adenosine modification protein YjeE